MIDKILVWMIACFGHAWWDAWFGVDVVNERLDFFSYKYRHELGVALSLIWFILFLAIFDFKMSFVIFGWLLIGIAFTGLTTNGLRLFHPDISNPDNVEWWFKIKIPLPFMCCINVWIFCIGFLMVISF